MLACPFAKVPLMRGIGCGPDRRERRAAKSLFNSLNTLNTLKRSLISMATKFDAIVVGTGQSGPSMAARLSQEGLNVAVIERQKFGGTCVNTG